jgi:hypothetical protein
MFHHQDALETLEGNVMEFLASTGQEGRDLGSVEWIAVCGGEPQNGDAAVARMKEQSAWVACGCWDVGLSQAADRRRRGKIPWH